MPDISLDLRFLRYAMACVEHGSFRQAALALGIAQSTVSRRVMLLEHRLGVPLFDRHRNGVRLTAQGKDFLETAADSATHLRLASRNMVEATRGSKGTLRIGIYSSLSKGNLPELLKHFIAAYPCIRIRIDEDTPEANLTRLRSGRIDIVFTAGRPLSATFQIKELWRERIVLAMPAGHALEKIEQVTWESLRQERFIVSSGGGGPDLEGFLIKHLFDFGAHPSIVRHGVGRENLMHLVAHGLGISLIGEDATGVSYPGVTYRVLDNFTRIPYSAVWMPANSNPAIKKLLNLSDTRL